MRNFLLLLVTLVLSVATAEIGLRLAGKFQPLTYPPPTRLPELYGPASEYGYALHPSSTNTYSYPPARPRVLTVSSNAHGFRDSRELDEADDRPRVLVAGDSFVFGEGVEQDEHQQAAQKEGTAVGRRQTLSLAGWAPVDRGAPAFRTGAQESGPELVPRSSRGLRKKSSRGETDH